jgi:formylglycine-generating enzyme required for sulfatase activity
MKMINSMAMMVALATASLSQAASTTLPQPGQSFRDCPDCPEMVVVPAGSFMMGANKNFEDAGDDETPQHTVNITHSFAIGKYEVTQSEWVAVMGSNPSEFKGRTNPVEKVSWNDVQRFISGLNAKTGKQYRLPTEAEWEYAARAGSQATYCFGDDKGQLGRYAWFDGNSGEKTHPVGQLQPNSFGLYDMHGNVYEWCSDWYGEKYYQSTPSDNPTGPSSGSHRVDRGGEWNDYPWRLRAANRFYNTPDYAYYHLGFRLVLPSSASGK